MDDKRDYESALVVLLHCEEMKKWPHRYFSKDVRDAISALEKQLPKKPLVRKDGFEFCPVCERCVTNANFCPGCGQKIDWDNDETGFDDMPKPEDLTCFKCSIRSSCKCADDPYNTDGDCLALK